VRVRCFETEQLSLRTAGPSRCLHRAAEKRQNAPKSDKNRTTTAENGGNLEGGPKSELYTLRVDVKLRVYVRRLSSLCIFAPRNTAHDLTRNNGATCTRSCTRQPENEPENVRPGGSTNGAVGKVISTTLVSIELRVR